MERLNLGPDKLLKENPKLIYARLTGFGQSGTLAKRAGHDINYLAVSGILSFLGRKTEKPLPPVNLMADFAAGGLLCAFGICMALLDRHKTSQGQVVDSAMVDGSAYIASWLLATQSLPIWGNKRGENQLDSGAFYYEVYETKDGKFMSVGCLEPQFFKQFIEIIDLPQLDQGSDNDEAKKIVQEKFLTKTQKEWSEIFEPTDACVYPVVEWENAFEHEHNRARSLFKKNKDGIFEVQPAPRLSRTPGSLKSPIESETDSFEVAVRILKDIGINDKDVEKLIEEGVVNVHRNKL
ncbi:AMACR family protein [Megaselia abdita]